MTKKVLAVVLLLTVMMTFSAVAFADGEPTLVLTASPEGPVDPGDEVTINISVNANGGVGIAQYLMMFAENDCYSYVAGSYEVDEDADGRANDGSGTLTMPQVSFDSFKIGDKNYTSGVIATLKIKIKEDVTASECTVGFATPSDGYGYSYVDSDGVYKMYDAAPFTPCTITLNVETPASPSPTPTETPATPTPTETPATPTPTETPATPTPTTEPTPTVYKVTGEDTWNKAAPADNGITLSSEADFEKFVAVYVDEKLVPPETADGTANYTVATGSTRVTFSKSFLNTLAVGDHNGEIRSNDGSAPFVLHVIDNAPATATPTPTAAASATPASGSPKTGDESNLVLWIVVLAVLAAAAVTVTVVYRKRSNH